MKDIKNDSKIYLTFSYRKSQLINPVLTMAYHLIA